MNTINPMAGKISKSREVLGCRKPLRLKATYLARRSRTTLSRFAADNPAHRRIMAQGARRRSHLRIRQGDQTPTVGTNRTNACLPFLPIRASASKSLAITVRPSVSSSSR